MVARTKRTVSQAADARAVARAADRSPTRTVPATRATAGASRPTRATEEARTEVKVAEEATRPAAATTTNKSKHFVDSDTYGQRPSHTHCLCSRRGGQVRAFMVPIYIGQMGTRHG